MTDDEAREVLRTSARNCRMNARDARRAVERAEEAGRDSHMHHDEARGYEHDAEAYARALELFDEVERLRSKVHNQRHEIRRLRALCGDDRAPDAHRGGVHSLPEVQASAKRAAEQIERDWPQWKKDLSGPSTEPTAELRAEAERLAREIWGGYALVGDGETDYGALWHAWLRTGEYGAGEPSIDLRLSDEPTALRALVAALREIRRGNGTDHDL